MRAEIEETEPEREPLRFDVNFDGYPPETAELVTNIKNAAEKILYHWKTFPINLPPPIAIIQDAENPGRRKTINMRDLFIAPSFDELDAVAMDTKGQTRKLTVKQLRSVEEEGEFDVDSMNFPGQVHRWRLSQLLQKGTRKAHETMLNDMAFAVRFIVVTARNRIHSHFLSLSQALSAWVRGILQCLDVIIGIPSLCARDLDAKIREERCKFLVAEMVVRPTLEDDFDNLCQFIKHQIRKQKTEKYRIDQERPPPIPYSFQTPKGIEIDLRLFNRVKKLTDSEIERQANIVVMDEYLQRVYTAVLSHPDISNLGHGIGKLLVDHAQSIVLMHRAVENVQSKLRQSQNDLEEELKTRSAILSRIKTWLREKLRAAEEKFVVDHMWSAHEAALQLCRENHLEQNIYFLQRDLAFMQEREPILLQELSSVKIPTRVFHWQIQIWCPQNWIITKVQQGESEVVPTVINRNSAASFSRFDPSEPRYLVEKQATRTSSTRWPLWRWFNYCYRTFSWLCNLMFLFGIVIPWCSPVSLRALFCIDPFMPDFEMNDKGVLVPRKSSVTQTLCSRLTKLWRHISKSRTEFETRPDTGFIGKGFTRHLNRLWNYVLKGLCGTLMTVLVFPVVCIGVSCMSLVVAVFAPLWVPVVTFLFHLICVLVYDFDSPDTSRNPWFYVLEAVVWRFVILGFLQPIVALAIAFLVCPVITLIILMVAVIRRFCRYVWDALMFHAVIKKRGRVPASDSFVARRIAGPGLESKYYFQILPEQALAAFEAKLEMEELTAYRDEIERLIQRPQLDFSNFVGKVFHPFSAALIKEGAYKQLEKEAIDISNALREKVDRRKLSLQTGLNISVRSKIKLMPRELKLTIKQAAIMQEKFYPPHIFQRLAMSEADFWEGKGLSFRDWPGLAGLTLSEIFSQDFLTPLEDVDTRFRLHVQHMNLFRYAEMLRTAEYRDDLDVVSTVHTPKGNIQVHTPFLDISTFNPLSKKTSTTRNKSTDKKSRRPWKRRYTPYSAEKLWIPLPIPHPGLIAVIIHNRDSEHAIEMESEQCQAILRAIEEVTCTTGHEYVSIDLTPPDSQSLTSQMGAGGDGIVIGRSRSADLDTATVEDRSSDASLNVNLASSEDITLEADVDRVTYSHSSYSTTV
uniref:Uncharacterized protein n=1 Tax=Strigamia maritima TaxID=126957 RepID=T1J1W8_STRMM